MSATELLKEEHRAIKLMLNILREVAQRLEANEKVDPQDLSQMVEFIRVFADRCHHGKEEDLLFPALEETGVPREGGPIGVMLVEHDEGRAYARALAEAVGRYRDGREDAVRGIIENARNYANLLTQHIDKEDNILYVIADLHLSPEKQEALVREFGRVEEEKIGAGRHEEFHHLLRRLKKTYLG
ncbi:MAG: hemerythrin domain-containing protein [Firmicutes bacterium]|nr:hemerythrin domain-containing protein [Bacillota bacterium]MCL5040749.1 hemerythrin domain-containing protein [Bacillota bacterium]